MYRLLFVDDEALIREGVSENVRWEELGYELAGVCENGREACEFLKKHPVDVVMTDICMPFMDGMELSAFIQKEFPQIKVLILSGYDDFEYAKKAIKYGVEEYLLKPITSYELGDILTQLKEKLDREREKQARQEEIYSTYRKGQMLLYSDALLHTITGTKTEGECLRERKAVGIHLTAPYYLVGVAGLSIYIGNYELTEKRKKESALMAFIVYNLSQEIMKKYQGGEVCQGKDNRVFLLFAAEDPKEFEELMGKICSEVISRVNELMGLKLNIALGCWQKGTENIYLSYELAEKTLLQQFTAGDNCVIDSRHRDGDCAAQIDRITDNCIRHVREYDRELLREDFKELEQILRKSGYGRREAIDCLWSLKEKTDKLAAALGAGSISRPEEQLKEELQKAPGLLEAMGMLLDYMEHVIKRLEREYGSSGRSCAYQAYEYIEQHYHDSGLSLQEVCSHLGVSTSRFSNLFKQTFGTTFMDVVIGIRMEKAKELLVMTELKNYEIAEKVGFSDPHYFSIAFKKATGKSPTEYAKERKR